MERKIQIAKYFPDPVKFQEEEFQKKILTDGKFLHQLRLKLKEVRVLCDLLEFGYPSRFSPGSLFECYRSFYRKSGRLRDINVQIDLFNNICRRNKIALAEFNDFLSDKKKLAEDEIKTHLRQSCPELPGIEGVEFGVIELNGVREKLMAGRIGRILDKRQEIFVIKKLHWLRRQLKQIVYLNKIKLFNRPVLNKGLIECIHTLEVKLGRWHDITVLKDYILEYVTTCQHTADEKRIATVNEAVRTEEISMLKSVCEIEAQ